MNLLSEPAFVLDLVSRHYGISIDELLGDSRKMRYTYPRQVAMYVLRSRGYLTLEEIGHALGRDHSTVLYGVQHVERLLRMERNERESLALMLSTVPPAEVTEAEHEGAEAIQAARALIRRIEDIQSRLDIERRNLLRLVG